MPIKISKDKKQSSIKGLVEDISGVDISLCYQCRKCTSGCPVADLVQFHPAEIMKRLQLGAGEELLDSDLVWTCVSCETCSARCPMGISIASVVDALRAMSVRRGAPRPKGDTPLFNRAFLKTVQLFGRTYDIAMIAAYKIGSKSFMQDTDKLPAMLKKGKISLLPSLGGNRKIVRRIFSRTGKEKGVQ